MLRKKEKGRLWAVRCCFTGELLGTVYAIALVITILTLQKPSPPLKDDLDHSNN